MKSYVSMAQHQCPICLVMHDTGEILIKKDLRPTLEWKTFTGHSPCLTCQMRLNEGYLALIETADPNPGCSTVDIDVKRSGSFVFIHREVFPKIFNVPLPEVPMVFVEPGVIDKLRTMTEDGDTDISAERQDG